MLGKFATGVVSTSFWEPQGRDRQNASANELRHGRPPTKKPSKKFDEIVARNQKRTKVT